MIEITLYQAIFQGGSISVIPVTELPTRRLPTPTLQDDDPGCGGNVMDNQVPKYVTRARASFLLGMPEAELNRISKESGFGQVERAGNQKETYFTYEELQRICVLAEGHMETVG
jgi:hypothetical protein